MINSGMLNALCIDERPARPSDRDKSAGGTLTALITNDGTCESAIRCPLVSLLSSGPLAGPHGRWEKSRAPHQAGDASAREVAVFAALGLEALERVAPVRFSGRLGRPSSFVKYC